MTKISVWNIIKYKNFILFKQNMATKAKKNVVEVEVVESSAERKEPTKRGSLFPALSYLSTGYLLGFFVSSFFSSFIASMYAAFNGVNEELAGLVDSLWNAEKVVAVSIIALVFVEVLMEVFDKRMDKKRAIVTSIVALIFLVLVFLSGKIFGGLFF